MIRPPLFDLFGSRNTCKIASFIDRILHTIVKVMLFVFFFQCDFKSLLAHLFNEGDEDGGFENSSMITTDYDSCVVASLLVRAVIDGKVLASSRCIRGRTYVSFLFQRHCAY